MYFIGLAFVLLCALTVAVSAQRLQLPGGHTFAYISCRNANGKAVPGANFKSAIDNGAYTGECPRLWVAGAKHNDNATLFCDASADTLTVRMLSSVVDYYGTNLTLTTTVTLTLSKVGRIEGDLRGGDDRWHSRNALTGSCSGSQWPKMHVDGGHGHDLLQTGENDDTLFGNHGIDILIGRDGNDVLWAGTGRTYADGGKGRDYVRGGGDNDLLFGGADGDTVVGFGQSDLATGDGSALGKFDVDQIKTLITTLNLTTFMFDTTLLSSFVCDDLTPDRLLLRRRQGAGFDILVRGVCTTPGVGDCARDGFDIMDGKPRTNDVVINGTFSDCTTLLPSFVTPTPTTSPTQQPSDAPTQQPTDSPTKQPTDAPTASPSLSPTQQPTNSPSLPPTQPPTNAPTMQPTAAPVVPVTFVSSPFSKVFTAATPIGTPSGSFTFTVSGSGANTALILLVMCGDGYTNMVSTQLRDQANNVVAQTIGAGGNLNFRYIYGVWPVQSHLAVGNQFTLFLSTTADITGTRGCLATVTEYANVDQTTPQSNSGQTSTIGTAMTVNLATVGTGDMVVCMAGAELSTPTLVSSGAVQRDTATPGEATWILSEVLRQSGTGSFAMDWSFAPSSSVLLGRCSVLLHAT